MYEYDNNRFRENLAYLMERHGRNQVEVAESIGATGPTISRYLSGNRKPTVKVVVKIAQFFNVTTDWLLGVSSDNNKEVKNEH